MHVPSRRTGFARHPPERRRRYDRCGHGVWQEASGEPGSERTWRLRARRGPGGAGRLGAMRLAPGAGRAGPVRLLLARQGGSRGGPRRGSPRVRRRRRNGSRAPCRVTGCRQTAVAGRAGGRGGRCARGDGGGRGGRRGRGARAGGAGEDLARAVEAAGPRRRHHHRRFQRGRVPRPRRRLRAERRRVRTRCHRGALGHRAGLLPLPGQVPVPCRGRIRRLARRSRFPEGRAQGRRVLRADGGVLRVRRGPGSGRPRGRRRRDRRRHHLPGMCGRRPVLSADHQDRVAAAAGRTRRHRRRPGERRVQCVGLRRRERGRCAVPGPREHRRRRFERTRSPGLGRPQ